MRSWLACGRATCDAIRSGARAPTGACARGAVGPVESAWISTIHGFCARVLRADALEAGIDPVFSVASATEIRILQSEGFAAALERFVEGDEAERLDLLARYGRDRLRRMVA